MATRETPRIQRTPRAKAASDGVPPKASGAPTAITALAPTPQVAQSGYVLPVVHLHLSERVVNAGFWTALAGTAALGVVDLPLAALIGGAVYVARHHARSGT